MVECWLMVSHILSSLIPFESLYVLCCCCCPFYSQTGSCVAQRHVNTYNSVQLLIICTTSGLRGIMSTVLLLYLQSEKKKRGKFKPLFFHACINAAMLMLMQPAYSIIVSLVNITSANYWRCIISNDDKKAAHIWIDVILMSIMSPVWDLHVYLHSGQRYPADGSVACLLPFSCHECLSDGCDNSPKSWGLPSLWQNATLTHLSCTLSPTLGGGGIPEWAMLRQY